MHVFITGGTGFIGSAITGELRAAGHTVTGLARTDDAAARLAVAGVTPRRGDLSDLAGLREAAAGADAVIHCAFIHDFSDYAGAARTDFHAAGALIEGLASSGPGKVLVSTSGTAGMRRGEVATETDVGDPEAVSAGRLPTERIVREAAGRGVRTAVLRLPPSVHGPGDHGFVPMLMDLARRTGVSAYLDDGSNRWGAVHRDDAAALYRIAAERLADGSLPPGAILHGVADAGIAFREIAQAIADALGLGPAEPRAPEHFGWFAMFAGIDNPVSSALTAQWTGWRPTRPGLLADLGGPAYRRGGAT
jgi:nucleoside-diphosphate-sugar epimerase